MCTPSNATVYLLLLLLCYYWLLVPASRAHHQDNIYKKLKNAGAYCTKTVGIATDYGLDGPGSNPGGYEIFRRSRPVLGSTQPPVKWVPGLSRG